MAQIRDSLHLFRGRTFRISENLRFSIWPFTTPLTDVILSLSLVPIFWVLGFEQIIPYAIIFLAGIKIILFRKSFHLPLPGRIVALFLLLQLISFLSIDIPTNRIVFLKNWLTYLAGLTVFIIIVNEVKTNRDLSRVLNGVFWLMLVATIIGVLFLGGLLPERYESLGGRFLPDFLKQSTFIQDNVIQREIGLENAYIGNYRFRRVSSIFLFPGTASLAYLVAIPLLGYTWYRSPRASLKARGLLFILPFFLLVFLATGTRTAILLLPASCLLVLIIHWLRRLPRLTSLVVLIILIIVAVIFLLLTAGLLKDFLNLLFIELRAGSFIDRMDVYRATFDSLRGKLLMGWGAPRRIETVQLAPAGTHGDYLFVLYSYGLIGLILYLAFLFSVWVKLIRNLSMSRPEERREYYPFYLVLAIILLSLTLSAIAHGINFDLTTALLFWLVMGLVFIKLKSNEKIQDSEGR